MKYLIECLNSVEIWRGCYSRSVTDGWQWGFYFEWLEKHLKRTSATQLTISIVISRTCFWKRLKYDWKLTDCSTRDLKKSNIATERLFTANVEKLNETGLKNCPLILFHILKGSTTVVFLLVNCILFCCLNIVVFLFFSVFFYFLFAGFVPFSGAEFSQRK